MSAEPPKPEGITSDRRPAGHAITDAVPGVDLPPRETVNPGPTLSDYLGLIAGLYIVAPPVWCGSSIFGAATAAAFLGLGAWPMTLFPAMYALYGMALVLTDEPFIWRAGGAGLLTALVMAGTYLAFPYGGYAAGAVGGLVFGSWCPPAVGTRPRLPPSFLWAGIGLAGALTAWFSLL